MSDTEVMDANSTDMDTGDANANVSDAAGTPPGSPSGGGQRDDNAPDDLVQDEEEGEGEDEDEDDTIEKGTWLQFTRPGEEGTFLGKMKKDYCCKSKSGTHWMCEVRVHTEERKFSLTFLRERVLRTLEVDSEGEPIVPSDSEESASDGDDDDDDLDDAEAEEEKQKQQKKKKKAAAAKEKKEKKEKPVKKTISKKATYAKKRGVEVDHETSCRQARAWSAETLKLGSFKEEADATEVVPEVRSGDDDVVLKKIKDDPSGHDFNGYTLWGRVLKFAEERTSDLEGRDQLASILIMMLTSKHGQYKDVKGLMKFVNKMAPYNVQGHLCEDVFDLDCKCKDQRTYVKLMYAKLTELTAA